MQIIDEIKSKYDIFTIAQLAGIDLKKASRNLYYSPFRNDRKASFSIYDNGRKFKDFATNETGDSITFYALVKNIENKQAIKELSQNVGSFTFIAKNQPTKYPLEEPKEFKPSPTIPPLEWDIKRADVLSKQRGFNIEALKYAFNIGVFGFCKYKGFPSWIITDKARLNAQARRLDGKLYNEGRKACTLKNSIGSYPLGLSEIANKKLICIAEGSTDFLALWHFAYIFDVLDTVAPIAMLGATQNISKEYLNSFEAKHILIFADADKAGKKALQAWGDTLVSVARIVRYFDYAGAFMHTGEKVKDLCEFMQLDYDYWESIRPYDNPFYNELLKINKEN